MNKSTPHTPGPWLLMQNKIYPGGYLIFAVDQKFVSSIELPDNNKQRAEDAKLLAGAADMYEALRQIERVAPSHIGYIATAALAKVAEQGKTGDL